MIDAADDDPYIIHIYISLQHALQHTLQHQPQRALLASGPAEADLYTIYVASISRLLKIIGLFCKRALQKTLYSAEETYDFKEPTNRSHPIGPF